MTHEVKEEIQDETAGVRNALEAQIGPDRLDLWIPECTVWHVEGHVLTLTFSSDFSAQLAQKMLGKDLSDAVSGHLGPNAELRMETGVQPENTEKPLRAEANQSPKSTVSNENRQPSAAGSDRRIDSAAEANHRTTRNTSVLPGPSAGLSVPNADPMWERIVQGESNQIARATAKLVVNSPGSMTPVFLHGPSGVGKSLLVSAVAQRLRIEHRLPRVVQMTSEQFLNDFTDGLRGGGLPMFRRKYRDVEVLILEDIHFFLGKKSSIAEAKHTIDNLLRQNKQVICTADRSLNDLQGLGNEFVARLRGGLTTPMFPLDEQVRFEILKRDLADFSIDLDNSVIQELAARLTGDGRVLSGVVKRLIATMAVEPNGKLSWEKCWSAVGDLVQATQPVVRILDIDRVVCDVFGLEPESLQSPTKIRRVSQPRMLAMFLARKYTPSAYKEIGQYFGKRRHSTVISAEKTVEAWLDENAEIEVGRGLNVRQAIRHVESQLQVG